MKPVAPLVFGVVSVLMTAPAPAQEQTVDFRSQIRPLLSDRCFHCHGPDADDRQGDLRLDTLEGATADLGGYAAVQPGASSRSAMLERITSSDPDLQMPPADSGKKLSPAEVDLIRRWIDQGAEYQQHWAYEPLASPVVPRDPLDSWSINEIDRFVVNRLRREKLQHSPQADPVTLARRLHFDLTGLPPLPEVVEQFAADPTDAAYEKLVDDLLNSPRYGERLAIFWLDLVRYADTVGYHGDQDHAISPYRDYVIQSFNDDIPFDRFTLEQLAGDLLPDATEHQRIASGYNRLLQTSHEGGVQQKEYLAKYSADRVRNFSEVWLGATMGCAECHNHKYDPYTQRDFYSMAAFFADVDDTRTFKGTNSLPTRRDPEIEVVTQLDRLVIEQLERQRAAVQQQLDELGTRDTRGSQDESKTPEQTSPRPLTPAQLQKRQQLEQQLTDLDARIAERAKPRRTMITESIKPRPIRVLARGDWMDDTGEIVPPAVPGFLPAIADTPSAEGKASSHVTRLQLARWVVAENNPLPARVFVNRIWRIFFGSGISPSLDDLGAQGEPPTHPELLDWLAADFRDNGWRIKRLVKQIVLSRTYRQSSLVAAELAERDPANRLLARQSRFRLEAELIRDNALAVSGLLVEELGGRSVKPYQPPGYYQHLNFPKRSYKEDSGPAQFRRGLYTHWQRIFLHPMLKAFDAPSREECTAQRSVSNTPLASLVLLNDPTFVEAARAFASRILDQPLSDDRARITWAFRQVVSRRPDTAELETVAGLLEAERESFRATPNEAVALLKTGQSPPPLTTVTAEHAAWTSVARLLLNLNETITRN